MSLSTYKVKLSDPIFSTEEIGQTYLVPEPVVGNTFTKGEVGAVTITVTGSNEFTYQWYTNKTRFLVVTDSGVVLIQDISGNIYFSHDTGLPGGYWNTFTAGMSSNNLYVAIAYLNDVALLYNVSTGNKIRTINITGIPYEGSVIGPFIKDDSTVIFNYPEPFNVYGKVRLMEDFPFPEPTVYWYTTQIGSTFHSVTASEFDHFMPGYNWYLSDYEYHYVSSSYIKYTYAYNIYPQNRGNTYSGYNTYAVTGVYGNALRGEYYTGTLASYPYSFGPGWYGTTWSPIINITFNGTSGYLNVMSSKDLRSKLVQVGTSGYDWNLTTPSGTSSINYAPFVPNYSISNSDMSSDGAFIIVDADASTAAVRHPNGTLVSIPYMPLGISQSGNFAICTDILGGYEKVYDTSTGNYITTLLGHCYDIN